ncbi:MAG: cysteine desulfurase [Clostridiales bacterium]|nr:cysteine desulfurase [Clostridiales bacterium]
MAVKRHFRSCASPSHACFRRDGVEERRIVEIARQPIFQFSEERGSNAVIYADHAATTPLLPCARAAMEPYLNEEFANPSSQYRAGRKARRDIELARRRMAELLGCQPGELYFTSGGSEGNAWAVWNGALWGRDAGKPLVTTSIEHHSLLRACQGAAQLGVETVLLPVDGSGRVSPASLAAVLERRPALVSIQYANNEIGTVQQMEALSALCREQNIPFHTDGVQAIGRTSVNLRQIDMLTASAHKFGGPKGIGFLYARKGLPLHPLIYGGSQERGLRGGTENVAAVVGMAAALEETLMQRSVQRTRLAALAQDFVAALLAGCPRARFHLPEGDRLPGLVSVALPGISGEQLVYRMDMADVAVSAGAACDQGERQEVSHVLRAIGLSRQEAEQTIRLSFGPTNSPEDGRQAAERLLRILAVSY